MLNDVDMSKLATPYEYEDEQFNALGHNFYPDWPAGLLRISIEDFASYIKIYTNQGIVDGKKIF